MDVRPLTSVVRIESNVPNAQLTLDGMPINAPFTFTGVEGIVRTLGVVTPQTSGGATYDFVSWFVGGPATHEIDTPNDDTTLTALFQPAATTTLFATTSRQPPAGLTSAKTLRLRAAGSAAIHRPPRRWEPRCARPCAGHRSTAPLPG